MLLDRSAAGVSEPRSRLFRSWLMGGFEGATMDLDTGRRVDVIGQTRHDLYAERDYGLLASMGVFTARDALRWHLIERTPRHYDWSSFLPMLKAAERAGVQVIWDLCHFGLPDDVDPWSADLVDRFGRFAREAARIVSNESDAVPLWCPVNEISYWAFAGGDQAHFAPMGERRGPEWKRQLVRLALAARSAVCDVDRRARIIHTDPVIHIAPASPEEAERAEAYRLSMFEAWDMIAGRRDPDLGGSPAALDILGVNFYSNNEWIDGGPRLNFGDPLYRPLSSILGEVKARYGRPIIIAETGAEAEAGPYWLRHVGDEVRQAKAQGTTIEGLCLYPVMDYPGWTDDRHCRCGPIAVEPDWTRRYLDTGMARAMAEVECAISTADQR